jgi:uncharacterized protein (DUF849 family)
VISILACVNGSRTTDEHPAVPTTPQRCAAEAAACAGLGAFAVHVHTRGADGAESLAAADTGDTVGAIRVAAPMLPVGVTTGAWILPDPAERLAAVTSWGDLVGPRRPDFASVNVSEDGWERVARALLNAGIGVEPGLFTAEDADRLRASGLAGGCTRLMIEPSEQVAEDAIATCEQILTRLRRFARGMPLLADAQEEASWPVLRWATSRGIAGRTGLEDTLLLPDGTRTEDNAALVKAAFNGS